MISRQTQTDNHASGATGDDASIVDMFLRGQDLLVAIIGDDDPPTRNPHSAPKRPDGGAPQRDGRRAALVCRAQGATQASVE